MEGGSRKEGEMRVFQAAVMEARLTGDLNAELENYIAELEEKVRSLIIG